MSEEQNRPIVPVEQKSIDFYGDEVLAVAVEVEGERQVFVPIRPIAERLGLRWSGQFERIKRHAVLGPAVKGVRITRTPSSGGRGGGPQEMVCLPLEYLPGWLFGIETGRITDEKLREAIIRYQRECFRVLWEAFQAESLARREPGNALAQIRGLALAIAQQAEQQMLLEGRVETVENRLDRAADVVKTIYQQQRATREDIADLRDLVDELADQVKALPAPTKPGLTPEQKATIRDLVEDLVAAADAHGAKLWQGKNNYQSAYRALQRKYDVSRYDELSQEQYTQAVEWLRREIARIEESSE